MVAPDPLLPSDRLKPHDGDVRRRVDGALPELSAAVRDGEAGVALGRALLFERWPELLGTPVDPETMFYNRYFWFVRFLAHRQSLNGPDAGLEQQAFQLMENAGFDVDFELLGRIDARARNVAN